MWATACQGALAAIAQFDGQAEFTETYYIMFSPFINLFSVILTDSKFRICINMVGVFLSQTILTAHINP